MTNAAPNIATRWLYLFIGMAVLVNFSGLLVPIMAPDGALYATIAKTMVQRNNYVELFSYGADWLDKPHFPFWMAAFSFKLFGIITWAYKLPAILFLLVGAWYTYLFGKALYNKQVGLWAALILLTAQHIILSNMDVRAEPYLTGLIIASVYHLYKANNSNSYWELLWGCLFTACAIMTKGMFALITIAGAIVGHLIITRQWRSLFHIKWLIGLVLVLIFILPEIYCLYVQFDAHPEKLVFGTHGVSGIKFFFWDSQFGRFFNTGPIKGNGDPFFFLHTALWAFLPWSLLMFAAVFQFIKKGKDRVQATEWYCISGALLTFLLFSASKFQLPHYLNIVFPFFAIITAQYLYNVKLERSIKAISITQTIIFILLLLVIETLHVFYQPETFSFTTKVLLTLLILAFFVLPYAIVLETIPKLILRTAIIAFIVNIYLNQVFYSSLLKYQAGSEAGMWISQHNPKKLPVVQTDDDLIWPLEFYNSTPVSLVNANAEGKLPQGKFIFYGTAKLVNELRANGWQMRTIKQLDRYWISRLKPAFLNKATRAKELTRMEVVVVEGVK